MEPHFNDHHITPPRIELPQARIPTDLDEYLFDLNGFVVIRGALSKEEVADANARIDRIPRSLPRLGWHGWVQREDHPEHRGISYQQVYELGGAFERMIDHPSYINYVLRFVGGHDCFDYHHGPLFIDENFFSIRGPGEAITLHAGGHDICKRMAFRYHNGRFQCAQINVLIAFTDIGPGDGATMVIPGSHKSNMIHPEFLRPKSENPWGEGGGGSVDGVAGAQEVHMKAGDAIVFVDATCHGSAKRVNAGERRICVYRYGSSWNRTRWGYHASPELLARVSPFARKLVHPQEYIRPPGTAARW
ncbi:MAG: phytanoyl-CoA dioxygenase family protein [Verrucomicrobia bacterium]|nr:phytanoyl-CoA dioxygenase family protein [Verrucomicrobiota bacterium]